MADRYNLLFGKPANEGDYEYIIEEANRNSAATMYIKGPYMGAEIINRNNRMYPMDELRKEVTRYIEEMVKPGRAMGELNHPASAEVNPERACHIITELYEDGNVYIGKSRVLSTPLGQIVRNLINDGIKLGMSSRALGTLQEGSGHSVVRNMKLVAVDCVADPSYSKAFVDPICESKQFILAENGRFVEAFDKFEKHIASLPKKDVDAYLREGIMKLINSL